MEQIESGIESLTEQTNQVSGRVKLSIPHSFFRSFVAPTIEKFLKTYPKVHLDLVLNNDQSKPETDRDLLITFDIEDMDDMIASQSSPPGTVSLPVKNMYSNVGRSLPNRFGCT